MAKTQGERIEELLRQLTDLSRASELNKTVSDLQTQQQQATIVEIRGEVKSLLDLCNRQGERIATVEQRCVNLEKHTDRSWQVWLALLGSLLALIVAIVKK